MYKSLVKVAVGALPSAAVFCASALSAVAGTLFVQQSDMVEPCLQDTSFERAVKSNNNETCLVFDAASGSGIMDNDDDESYEKEYMVLGGVRVAKRSTA